MKIENLCTIYENNFCNKMEKYNRIVKYNQTAQHRFMSRQRYLKDEKKAQRNYFVKSEI